jgi:DNA-binding MurR/RpiR family transcriptional regulator
MSTPPPPHAPESEEALIAAMAREYPGLSRQLKQIGTYVEQHRGQLGIQSIQQVAELCEVQPSAVVRFAKHFGFSGFTEMQKLFRDGHRVWRQGPEQCRHRARRHWRRHRRHGRAAAQPAGTGV